MPHTLPTSRVIAANDYRRVRWNNGLGWTCEIHAASVDSATAADAAASGHSATAVDWDWRLSIAEIERDTRFSTFDGIDRELVLLRGNGLRLRFDDGELCTLQPPFGKLRFSGERGVGGELIDGPTHDFNLMWRPARLSAELLHRPLVGSMLFFAEPGSVWALHLLAGDAHFPRDCGLPPLQAGDTALLSEPVRTRFLLHGGGELLAIALRTLG